MKKFKRNGIIVVLCVIVCAALLIIWNKSEGGFINKYFSDFENVLVREGEVKTISKASLKNVFDIDEEKKVITITIPDIRFTEITVNPGTLKYIFKDKKSETETVHQEAFKICKEDLAERVDKEKFYCCCRGACYPLGMRMQDVRSDEKKSFRQHAR